MFVLCISVGCYDVSIAQLDEENGNRSTNVGFHVLSHIHKYTFTRIVVEFQWNWQTKSLFIHVLHVELDGISMVMDLVAQTLSLLVLARNPRSRIE